MRTLVDIGNDIDAAAAALDRLIEERVAFLAARRESIVRAFDDGATRAEICAAFEVDYGTLGSILHRAGRSERQRRAAGLPIEKRPHYDKLLRQGMPSRMAAQIAESLT